MLDLRGTDELGGECHPLADQAAAVHAVALLDKPAYGRGTQWSESPDLATAYLGFLSKGGPVLATVAKFVAEAPAPVLVHCAAGKDRTGVAVAVLLRAVGVTGKRCATMTGAPRRTCQPSSLGCPS